MTADHEPHLVDIHVGARIRLRRKAMGLTQTQLANSVGITFQQLQKYERGANRVSASKLYGMAVTLQISVAWFFEGMASLEDSGESDPRTQAVLRFMATKEGVELASLVPQLPMAQRLQILALAKTLSMDDEAERAAG
ncbi:Cro/Cl family transcriptional regulator [Caulobacter sp. Root487D2Y]|uniref:helix-turn-helix domain-containing protein n=1 Tax=Caulobacter sp. Root487D2Y TaxID=1736547 RepID=UPI0007012EB8|nr:helix-turn-helix transcriptional regulator [Caulobacter sp. Root487D2Y]KQY28893.1 Cro/Cl family transcriptional regulator [Caulobacter sp. Root487D2Y]